MIFMIYDQYLRKSWNLSLPFAFDFQRHGSGLQSYVPGTVSVHSPAPEKQSARVPEPKFSPIKQQKIGSLLQYQQAIK